MIRSHAERLTMGITVKAFSAVLAAVLALYTSPSHAQPEGYVNVGSGAWKISETRDPITDKGSAIAAIFAGQSGIAFKCDGKADNAIYIVFASVKFLGGTTDNTNREVITRFDNDTPQTDIWHHYGNRAELRGGARVAAFARQIVAAKTFAIRATTFDGETVTAVIPVADGREAIERAYKACGAVIPW